MFALRPGRKGRRDNFSAARGRCILHHIWRDRPGRARSRHSSMPQPGWPRQGGPPFFGGPMRILLAHASPRDPLDEYLPPDKELWARRLQNVEADVVCVGHTHQPYVLEVGDKLVINPGSVGQPRDGDARASCAVIENYKVDI